MTNATAATCPHANDYSLGCCCNSAQIQVICAVGAYSVIFFLLWKTWAMEPLKVFTAALFEVSRAVGCWITCGSVVSLNLFAQPNVSSQFMGGNRAVIQLVGHLGSLLWGFVCVVASADYVGVQVVAGVLAAMLLVLAVLARTWRVAGSVLLLLVLIAAFWACTVLTVFNGLRFLVLAVGVTSLFFPLYNVCLVPKRATGYEGLGELQELSAAAKTGEFVWGVLALALAALALYLALVVASNPDNK